MMYVSLFFGLSDIFKISLIFDSNGVFEFLLISKLEVQMLWTCFFYIRCVLKFNFVIYTKEISNMLHKFNNIHVFSEYLKNIYFLILDKFAELLLIIFLVFAESWVFDFFGPAELLLSPSFSTLIWVTSFSSLQLHMSMGSDALHPYIYHSLINLLLKWRSVDRVTKSHCPFRWLNSISLWNLLNNFCLWAL